MKSFLKGTAVWAIVMIVLIAINVICNINGINLDSVSNGAVMAVCVMLIYEGWAKKEKKDS